jgi:hypothetical protein
MGKKHTEINIIKNLEDRNLIFVSDPVKEVNFGIQVYKKMRATLALTMTKINWYRRQDLYQQVFKT